MEKNYTTFEIANGKVVSYSGYSESYLNNVKEDAKYEYNVSFEYGITTFDAPNAQEYTPASK